jgi:hypothetical protein
MKFKIGDKVKIIGFPRMKCSIGDWVVNKPEELRMVDGEITYVVNHDNYRGEMVMFYTVKESELIKDIEA